MIIYGYPEAAPYVPNKTISHIAVETLAAPIKIQMGAVLIPDFGSGSGVRNLTILIQPKKRAEKKKQILPATSLRSSVN